MSTLVAQSDMARDVLSVYGLITWITLGIGALVFTLLDLSNMGSSGRPSSPPTSAPPA